MPPLSGVSACCYQQSQPRYITCQDVCFKESHVTKRLTTRSEHLKICCHVIITRYRLTVKQSARKFGNSPLQAVAWPAQKFGEAKKFGGGQNIWY